VGHTMKMNTVLAIVLLGAGYVACGYKRDFRRDVLVETNKLRSTPLKRDATLEKKAQAWADYLTGDSICKFYHQDPLPRMSRAENIALASNMSGYSVVRSQWWKSSGHKKNMMNEDYSRIGVGVSWGCKRKGHDVKVAVALYA